MMSSSEVVAGGVMEAGGSQGTERQVVLMNAVHSAGGDPGGQDDHRSQGRERGREKRPRKRKQKRCERIMEDKTCPNPTQLDPSKPEQTLIHRDNQTKPRTTSLTNLT